MVSDTGQVGTRSQFVRESHLTYARIVGQVDIRRSEEGQRCPGYYGKDPTHQILVVILMDVVGLDVRNVSTWDHCHGAKFEEGLL